MDERLNSCPLFIGRNLPGNSRRFAFYVYTSVSLFNPLSYALKVNGCVFTRLVCNMTSKLNFTAKE